MEKRWLISNFMVYHLNFCTNPVEYSMLLDTNSECDVNWLMWPTTSDQSRLNQNYQMQCCVRRSNRMHFCVKLFVKFVYVYILKGGRRSITITMSKAWRGAGGRKEMPLKLCKIWGPISEYIGPVKTFPNILVDYNWMWLKKTTIVLWQAPVLFDTIESADLKLCLLQQHFVMKQSGVF